MSILDTATRISMSALLAVGLVSSSVADEYDNLLCVGKVSKFVFDQEISLPVKQKYNVKISKQKQYSVHPFLEQPSYFSVDNQFGINVFSSDNCPSPVHRTIRPVHTGIPMPPYTGNYIIDFFLYAKEKRCWVSADEDGNVIIEKGNGSVMNTVSGPKWMISYISKRFVGQCQLVDLHEQKSVDE